MHRTFKALEVVAKGNTIAEMVPGVSQAGQGDSQVIPKAVYL